MKTYLYKTHQIAGFWRHDFWLAGMSRHGKKPYFCRERDFHATHATMPALLKTFSFFLGGGYTETPRLGGLAA